MPGLGIVGSVPPCGTGRLVQERGAHPPHPLKRLLVQREEPVV